METRIKKIIETLGKLYPKPRAFLNFRSPFELLVATILSAQCTDERVNKVTPALFKAANTPEKIVALGQKKLMKYIFSTGFYRAKAKNIIATSKKLVEKFHSEVPTDFEVIQTLPGVGRKTASVVLAQAFKIPTFPVDRHVLRVANRLALAHAKTPHKTDLQLRKNIPQKFWIPVHIQLISLGRSFCRPKPLCETCPLLRYCTEGRRRTKKT